jgi:hypothetical protein
MKLGEALIGGQRAGDERQKGEPHAITPVAGASAAGVAREIRARRRMRSTLRPGSPVYLALMAVTLLMELDLWLFGWMRCGSYFILVEKPR